MTLDVQCDILLLYDMGVRSRPVKEYGLDDRRFALSFKRSKGATKTPPFASATRGAAFEAASKYCLERTQGRRAHFAAPFRGLDGAERNLGQRSEFPLSQAVALPVEAN